MPAQALPGSGAAEARAGARSPAWSGRRARAEAVAAVIVAGGSRGASGSVGAGTGGRMLWAAREGEAGESGEAAGVDGAVSPSPPSLSELDARISAVLLQVLQPPPATPASVLAATEGRRERRQNASAVLGSGAFCRCHGPLLLFL